MPRWPAEGAAIAGDTLHVGVRDITSDLTALDSSGWWAVVLPFDEAPVCARFEHEIPLATMGAPIWQGLGESGWSTSLDRPEFEAAVETIRSEIARGDVYQVNLTRVVQHEIGRDHHILDLALLLRTGHHAPHEMAVYLPEIGLEIASASPELYLGRDADRVWSSPIKGTAVAADQFLEKDIAENVMIVDLVRNDLGRVCDWGSIEVPGLCVHEHHPGLVHLVSTVTGVLREGNGWAEAISATFPPGSVTGAPKEAALASIARLERAPRGPYCGSVGWVDADRAIGDLNVAIRTFWFADGHVRFGTGGGITWDSSPSGEWFETELKSSRLIPLASRPVQGCV